MASITIRNIPDTTKEALRVRAAQASMSLESFLRDILQAASQNDRPQSVAESAAEIFGAAQGCDLDLPARAPGQRGTVTFE
jgi:plasmid stability protein